MRNQQARPQFGLPAGDRVRALLAVLALVCVAPGRASAQEYVFEPRLQWEARADALLGAGHAAQGGVGANVPAGYYTRVGVTAAGGYSWRGGRTAAGARVDAQARFLLDPFREVRWGLYAGAGLSARWGDADHWRTYLLLLVGVEGPEHGGWRTSFEAGIGGGARVGIVLRRARRNGR